MTLNKKFASIGGAVLLVIGLVTTGFVLEDRYNNQNDHDKDIVHERSITALVVNNVEDKLVMNLEQFRKEQQVSLKSQKRENDYRYYTGLLENINSQIYKIKQWLREHPTDNEAREDYQHLQKKRDDVQSKLNTLMKTN